MEQSETRESLWPQSTHELQSQEPLDEQEQPTHETIKSSERNGNGVAEDCANGTAGVIAHIASWVASAPTG